MDPMPTALSIAASDPTGGAGVQSDVQVFRSLGVHGTSVITALTVQDSIKVHQLLPAFPSVVLDQLRTLIRDLPPRAVKTGALASDDVLRNVMLGLDLLDAAVPLVVDPVLFASDGTPLLERRGWPSLRTLISRAALVTPNLSEAEQLCERDVSSREGSEAAARSLVEELGADAALLKGGHRDGPLEDLLAVRERSGVALHWLPGERIDAGPVHGTGCALSSAITAKLARGDSLEAAVAEGRSFVRAGLRAALALGGGARFLAYP